MRGKTSSDVGRGGELNTIIGKGSVVEGDLRIQNSLRIDGKVVGRINVTETVVIGKEGEVEGEIRAKHVLLAGKVSGNVIASGKVLLESKASVLGDVKASRLVVDGGVLFDGQCDMKEKKGGGGGEDEKETEE